MSKGDVMEVNKIEVQSLKNLFSLPCTTPTVAVLYSFGQLYPSVHIDQKQLLYLHKILTRTTSHWTNQLFHIMNDLNIGWARQIQIKLKDYGLEENLDIIRTKSKIQWKTEVKVAVERVNQSKMKDECVNTKSEEKEIKSKTSFVLKKLEESGYKRKLMSPINQLSKIEAKTIILARFHMLECGRNFKNTLPTICQLCNEIDDENHRLNYCSKWEKSNLSRDSKKMQFENVYSEDINVLKDIMSKIARVWNVQTGNGSMR